MLALPYQVNLMMTCEVRAVGYMITGNMSIVNVQDPDEDLAQLDTAVYFPDAVDAVLSGDEEIDFGDISVIDTGDSDSADGAEDSLTQAGAETASSPDTPDKAPGTLPQKRPTGWLLRAWRSACGAGPAFTGRCPDG